MHWWTNSNHSATTMSLIERISAEVDTRFRNWAFRGSIVDWHYLDGQVMVKDFDIVTADPFEPDYACPTYGPRFHWKFIGRAIDVFYEADPGPRMQTIEARVERIKWLATKYPDRQTKYQDLLERYAKLLNPDPMFTKPISRTCPHRGGQLRTMTSDLCGTRGHNLPVFSCELHGECTHRQVCKGQDVSVKICVGCSDGPWAF
jgi:hypothetical protein